MPQKTASRGSFQGAPLLLSQGISPKPQSPLGGCSQPWASSISHDLKILLLIPRGTTLAPRGYQENVVISAISAARMLWGLQGKAPPRFPCLSQTGFKSRRETVYRVGSNSRQIPSWANTTRGIRSPPHCSSARLC